MAEAGPNPGTGSNIPKECPVCQRSFPSLQGMRQHFRLAHPDEYHTELAAKVTSRPKKRWDPEEVGLMAVFERDHPDLAPGELATAIQQHLLPHRSIEAIKGKRKQDSYKKVLRELALEPSQEPQPPPPSAAPMEREQPRRRPGRRRNMRSSNQQGEDPPPPEGEPDPNRTSSALQTQEERGGPSAGDLLRAFVEELSSSLGVPAPIIPAQIQARLDAWSPPKNTPRINHPPRPGRFPAPTPRRLRRRRYAAFQRGWKKDRGRVVKRVLSGEDLLATPVQPEGTLAFWKGLFSRPSIADNRQPAPIQEIDPLVMGPISEAEVVAALKSTKEHTAPGRDGRSLADLRALGVQKLLWLLNSCLMLGAPPSEWMQGRTTLLPKTEHPSAPGDFRPITVTPLCTRLLHKVLSKRLSTLAPLPERQKGFKREEGCAANLAILQGLVKRARTKPASLYVAWVDFAKAFDSVSHPSVLVACKRWGMPSGLTEYISRMLDMATTYLDEDDPTSITRGVLQGDPLSPYLFNICLDMALAAIPKTVGVQLGDETIRYLAFADDVALVASSRVGLQSALDSFAREAGTVGLTLGLRKCATLGIAAYGKRRTWAMDMTPFHLEGSPIRSLKPGGFYKYLGIQMGIAKGGTAHLCHADMAERLGRLLRAPAKPQQKLWALKVCLIPQYYYPLVNATATQGQLGRMDRAVRRFIRTSLHLPKDTPNAYIHGECVDGGLGVPSLATRVPRLTEDLRERLVASADPVVREVVRSVMRPAEETEGGVLTPGHRKAAERGRWSRQLWEAVDGRGLRGIDRTPHSSRWIDGGTQLLAGGDFVRAVKVRGNLLNTKVRAARGRQAQDVLCDLCHRQPESLGHIVQRCSEVQEDRTRRHDRVLDYVLGRLMEAGYQTLREHPVRAESGMRYPDIIAWRGDAGSWVLDVQVVADAAAGDLDEAHRRKANYYDQPSISAAVSDLTGSPPRFNAITASWRGVLAVDTVNVWVALGLRKKDLVPLTVRVLEGTAKIHRNFNRVSGGTRPHPG